jgi:hypothetical protein
MDENTQNKSNFDLLSANLRKESFAYKLVSAYREASPSEAEVMLKNALEKRLLDVKEELRHAKD